MLDIFFRIFAGFGFETSEAIKTLYKVSNNGSKIPIAFPLASKLCRIWFIFSRSESSLNRSKLLGDENLNSNVDSDGDQTMDSTYIEPQLLMDEFDEPLEFKYDPSSADSSTSAPGNVSSSSTPGSLLTISKTPSAASLMPKLALIPTAQLMGTPKSFSQNTRQILPKLQKRPKSSNGLDMNKSALLAAAAANPNLRITNVFSGATNDFMDLFANSLVSVTKARPNSTTPMSGTGGGNQQTAQQRSHGKFLIDFRAM